MTQSYSNHQAVLAHAPANVNNFGVNWAMPLSALAAFGVFTSAAVLLAGADDRMNRWQSHAMEVNG